MLLLVFCASFYGLIRAVDLFGNESSGQTEATEYSPARLSVDEALSEERWADAVGPLGEMLEADPFDGTAWYRLGNCHYNLWRIYSYSWKALKDRGEDAERIEDFKQLANDHLYLAIDPLERAVDFASKRNAARIRLAGVLANVGRKDEACRLIKARLDARFIRPRGLKQNADFLPLVGMPEFERLVTIENSMRSSMGNKPERGNRHRGSR